MSALSRLLKLDACAVSDALDKLGESGTVNGILPLTGPAKIAGRVVTVRLVKVEDANAAAPKQHLGTAAIEGAVAGDVIVVEHHSRDDCAGWGGILSVAAKQRALAGTIVDGLARDIDESREAGYPVFARAATPSTARGRIVEDAWNVTITVGAVVVNPGDLVIADSSGVVFIRAKRENEVLDAAETIAARERAMAEAVRAGKPVSQVMGGGYENMLGDDTHG